MAYSTVVSPFTGSGGGSGGPAFDGGPVSSPVTGPTGSASEPTFGVTSVPGLGLFAADGTHLALAVGSQTAAVLDASGLLRVGGLQIGDGTGPQLLASADGTPEGVVSASGGSVWTRKGGGADGLFYKASASGSTGWTEVGGQRPTAFPLSAPLGAASAPSYAFSDHADTGLHSVAGELGLSVAGQDLLTLGTDGKVRLSGDSTVQGLLTVTGGAALSGVVTLDAGAQLLNGPADPRGNVSAPPSSLYARSTGGSRTTLFIKESGTDATGWVAANAPAEVVWPLTAPDGSAAAPSFAFASSTGSGLFLSGADELALSTAGTQRLRLRASGVLQLAGALSVGSDAGPASTGGIFGNLTVGSGIAGTTAAPADGLLVQGQTTFQGSVAFQGGATGLSLQPTYPLSAPTGTSATPAVPYSFNGKSGWGLGYDTTSSFLNLYAASTPVLQLGSNVIQTTRPLGLGGATPSANLVSIVAGSAPLSGVYAGGASIQVQAPNATMAGGGSFLALTNSGTWGGSFGYNEYVGGASSTVGTYLIAANSKPLTVCVGANYLDVAGTVYSVGSGGSLQAFWNLGGKPQPLSTVGVTGNLAVGATAATGTAAPANGLLVQGQSVFQGNVTFQGTTSGVTATPSFPLSAPAGSAGSPSYGFSTGAAGLFSPSAGVLSLSSGGTARLTLAAGGDATFAGSVALSSGTSYFTAGNQARVLGSMAVGFNSDPASTLSVMGSVSIGANAGAPVGGLLVQGPSTFQGAVTFQGGTTGVTATPSFPLSAPAGSAGSPSYGFSGGAAGLFSPSAGTVALSSGGTARLTFNSGGDAIFSGSVALSSGTSYFTAMNQARLVGGVAVGYNSDPTSSMNISGNLAIGAGNTQTGAPANGLLVQGSTILQGNLTVQGTTSGISTAPTYPLSAPVSGTAQYAFSGGTAGLASPSNGNVALLGAGKTFAITGSGATLDTSILFSAGSAVFRGDNILTGCPISVGSYNTAPASTMDVFGNLCVGLNIAGVNNAQPAPSNGLLVQGAAILQNTLAVTGRVTAAEQVRVAGAVSSGNSSASPASTSSVFGNMTVGSGIASSTAAPSNGVLVQGDTILQGNLTVQGSATGIPGGSGSLCVNTALYNMPTSGTVNYFTMRVYSSGWSSGTIRAKINSTSGAFSQLSGSNQGASVNNGSIDTFTSGNGFSANSTIYVTIDTTSWNQNDSGSAGVCMGLWGTLNGGSLCLLSQFMVPLKFLKTNGTDRQIGIHCVVQ